MNVCIIVAALFTVFFRKPFLPPAGQRILLWTSIPLVLVFQSFSLFRSTLPHWTGPGYLGFILIAACFLAEPAQKTWKLRLVPWPLVAALALMLAVSVTAIGQIRYGWVPLRRWKANDPSLDLVGWDQLGGKFAPMAKRDEEQGLIGKNSPILTFRWFPAANFDYYVARRINKPVYALGTLERIHKYFWINQLRGNLQAGSDAYYIGLSDDYQDPNGLYGPLFTRIVAADTLFITRGRDTVRTAYIFHLLGLKSEMDFSPPNIPKGN